MPSKEKVRLDILIAERGLAESRTQAQALILAGRVRVPGQQNIKPGMLLPPDAPVELIEAARYVSRGGEKLEGALKDFGLEVKGLQAWDIGASTGGFTDCLLQNGATKVLAVDVGHGQLHWRLRADPRVVNWEERHVLEVNPADVADFKPGIVVVDVSFISLERVLPHLGKLTSPGVPFVVLVKPQFEAGPKNAPKGVVRDPKVRAAVIEKILGQLEAWGFEKKADAASHLKGPKGNEEHFLHIVRRP